MDKALRSVLSWWDAAGVDVPKVKPAAKNRSIKASRTEKPADQKTVPKALTPPGSAKTDTAKDLAASAKTLDDLRRVMSGFDAGEISDHARQMVFSRGNPKADIMVIGEAPGRDEDIQGKPFVGRSGQLLDKIFASIGLTDDSLYITNIVNWRPPGNRNPSAEEIAMCKPFLMRHIALIDPNVLVLVGGISFSALTGNTGIMKNRGQWTSLNVSGKEIPALPVYHPAFLLRQPSLKKDIWRDMLSLREKTSAI